jgi:porin
MQWDLVDRDGPNTGSLVVKPEYRANYTKVTPLGLGPEVGYAGLLNGLLNDQNWRLTHAHWRQKFADGKAVVNIGWLDVTDYADIFVLGSPWGAGFQNVAFETGSGVFGDLPDGSLGVQAGGFLTDNIYALALATDANSNASDPLNGFDTLFDLGQLWSAVEIGWTDNRKEMFVDNFHLTFYHVDARTTLGGAPLAPEGKGIAFSFTKKVGKAWLPFLRGGWGEGGGGFLRRLVLRRFWL